MRQFKPGQLQTGSLYNISASYALTSSYSNNLVVSGSIANVDYIDFNTGSATPAWKSGRVFWDNTDGALSVYNAEADITLQVGQENWTRVSNRTGATILNGTVVRLKGAHGDVPEVELAQSIQVTGSVNLQNQILGVATHNIEDNSKGYITTQGLVRGLNTNAFNDGDTLFVGTASAGVLQNVPPQAPFEIIPVGVCVKASPGGSGIIYVAVQEPIDFSDLSSVLAGTYSYGDIWTYVRSGSVGVWTHTNQLSGSYGLTGSLSATSLTASSARVNGNVQILGTASIAYLNVQYESASIIYSSGSNQFGDAANDTQTLWGTVDVKTGPLLVTGSVRSTGGFTGSFSGSVAAPGSTTQIVYNSGSVLGADSGFVYSGSRVGLGTSNPAFKLDVSGSIRIPNSTGLYMDTTLGDPIQTIFLDSGNNLRFNITSSGDVYFYQGSNVVARFVNGGQIHLGGTSVASSPTLKVTPTRVGIGLGAASPSTTLQVRGSGTTSATTALRVENTNASASLVVLDNGNVGIGTTTPSELLEVQGSILIEGAGGRLRLAADIGTQFSLGSGWNGIQDTMFIASSLLTPRIATFQSDGKIGIGTILPSASLHISGSSSDALLRVDSPASSSILFVTGSGRIGIGINTPIATLHVSGASNSSLLRVDSPTSSNIIFVSGSGQIGIGTNTPQSGFKVEVAGSTKIVGDIYTSNDLWFYAGTPSIRYISALRFIPTSGVTPASTLSQTGNLGIGLGNTDATARLHVSGAASSTLFSIDSVASSNILFVSGSGNIGINTNTPGMSLSVVGNAQFGFTSTSAGARLHTRGAGTTSTSTSFRAENNSQLPALRITDDLSARFDGKVSIGSGNFPTASLDVAGTTRISGSFNTAASGSILTVIGSGSAQPIFTVQGSQGELFSITDSLSGSLFSVNDISGLPILEVFSDNTTLIGNYQDPMLITTAKVVQTNSGSFTVYSLPTASYDTAFFEYSIRSGSNARAGTIMAMQLGSTVNFTETTTTDFGSTSAVSFTVIVTGSNMALTGSSTSGAWTIKTIVRGL